MHKWRVMICSLEVSAPVVFLASKGACSVSWRNFFEQCRCMRWVVVSPRPIDVSSVTYLCPFAFLPGAVEVELRVGTRKRWMLREFLETFCGNFGDYFHFVELMNFWCCVWEKALVSISDFGRIWSFSDAASQLCSNLVPMQEMIWGFE